MSIEKDFKKGKWAEDVFQEFYTRTHQGAKAERLELKAYADFYCNDETYGLTDIKESEATFKADGNSLNLAIEKFSTLYHGNKVTNGGTEGWIDHKIEFRGELQYPKTFFFIQPINGIDGDGVIDQHGKRKKFPVKCERAKEEEFKRFQAASKAYQERHPEDTRERRFIYEVPCGMCFKISREELLQLITGEKVNPLKKYDDNGNFIGYSGCYLLSIEKISHNANQGNSTISMANLVRYRTIDGAEGIAISEAKTVKYIMPERLKALYRTEEKIDLLTYDEKNKVDSIVKVTDTEGKEINKTRVTGIPINQPKSLEMLDRTDKRFVKLPMKYGGLITLWLDIENITTLETIERSVTP